MLSLIEVILKQTSVERLRASGFPFGDGICKIKEWLAENYQLQELDVDGRDDTFTDLINRNIYLAKQQRFKKVKYARID